MRTRKRFESALALFAGLVLLLASAGAAWGAYVDNGDGTVTDTATGLMWQQADDGQTWNWQDALSYCEALDLAEKTDWRLPNIRELISVVDEGRYNPAINPVFKCRFCLSGTYTSGSKFANDPYNGWMVNFYNGETQYGSMWGQVRCVRGGPTVTGDMDYDCDVDGKDLAMLISESQALIEEQKLATLAIAFGRTDCP